MLKLRYRLNIFSQGITLVELLLVIAILGILLASGYPVGSNFLIKNAMENNVNEITNSLRIAQLNSMSGKGDDTWGVYVSPTEATIFKGASYDLRDNTYDEVYKIANSVSVSPTPLEVVFDKLNGDTNSTIIFTLSNTIGESVEISINDLGIVDVN